MTTKRVTSSPTSIQILLTRCCNLLCSYCSAQQFIHKEKEPELETREWIDLLTRLGEIRVLMINFSGGEIFLREDIFDILENAVKLKFQKIRLTSNATLISAVVAKGLRDLNLRDISVSLDGTKETNDQIRGASSFENILKGIANLVDNGIIPEILFSPLKINYKNLDEIVDVLYSLGIKKLLFNALHPTGRFNKQYKEGMLEPFVEVGEFQEIVDELKGKYRDFYISNPPFLYKGYPFQYYCEDKSALISRGKPGLKICSAGHSSCAITSSGWVIPCTELFDFKGGNIRERDILDIWRHSENFEKIRSLSNILTEEIPYCRNCQYNIFCNAGCRADAYAVFGDLMAPDPFCPYWREK